MTTLIEEIAQGRWFDKSKVEGYTEEEIKRIEKLYDINIKGILKNFMLEMGRSSGGLLGDIPIILYRDLWSVRAHLIIQYQIIDDITNIVVRGDFEKIKEKLDKPLIFAIEAETQYYYINTGHPEPYTVFCYDENAETVENIGDSFLDYMKSLVAFYGKLEPKKIICRGDMITI